MKRLLMLLLAILVIGATGCIFGDDDKDDDNGGGNNTAGSYQATDYLPIKVGSSWSFQETYYYGEEPEVSDYTMTITGSETMDGHLYYAFENDYEDDWNDDISYMAVRDNILWMYEQPWDQVVKAALNRTSLSDAAKTAISAKCAAADDHLPWIDFTKSSWTIFTESSQEEYGSYSSTETGAFMGVENVTTPAGTYQNCLKFRIRSEYSFNNNEGSQPYNETMDTFIYFAKNVGPVKILMQYIEEGEAQTSGMEVLTAYNPAD